MNEHGPQSIRGIAAFDSVSEQWSALGKGAEGGLVYALLVAPRDIWASPSPVAPHDSDPLRAPGDTTSGISDSSELLFAAGDFKIAGGERAGGIAVWLVRERIWRSFGSLDGAVHALAALDGWLYAGGDFRVASGSLDGSGVARHPFPNAQSLAAFEFLILQRH